jgi:hypothetical protein
MIIGKTFIDRTNTMYPSLAYSFDGDEVGDLGYFYSHAFSNMYGYVHQGTLTLPNNKVVTNGEYFSFYTHDATRIEYTGKITVFTRIGFHGQDMIGGPVEEKGRLCYMDGCSDSLLIYPPRQGDPSASLLVFPQKIKQTYHTHPSIRLGVVISGSGYACINPREDEDGNQTESRYGLEAGMLFCLEEHELHRFCTEYNGMRIMAYHPDGDWGPTDHNHSMINRTYIAK